MNELNEKAKKFAKENMIQVLEEAFASIYAEGYRVGYKDCKEEIPFDMRDGKTEYVDLGLPSGTLWSTDYERIEGGILYLPYMDAELMAIPTEQQCNELLQLCGWEFDTSYRNKNPNRITCIGPNGKTIQFCLTGYVKSDNVIYSWSDSVFWIKTARNNGKLKDIVFFSNRNSEIGLRGGPYKKGIESVFMGYKLPIRLVKAVQNQNLER